jgi:hydrogenase maturation factor
MEKEIYIPYAVGGDLSIRVLLFEKIKPKLYGLNFCCLLNSVPVYTDSYMERGMVITGSQNDSYRLIRKDKVLKFLVVGYEPEEVEMDSFVLQSLTVLIEEVYESK